ncbi:MAG: TRASH domain-containing protein [Deltaproteobacteria bacterium]|nr:TRASH domain-containing protein [Deltaproteobacteria bacterium]
MEPKSSLFRTIDKSYFSYFLKALLMLPLMLISLNVVAEGQSSSSYIEKVEPKKVCMVNNKFMGIDQIPVEVEEKTYYGCCENCVSKLNKDKAVRYATDPMTGEQVDKAHAFTAMVNDGSNKALYFKSEKTYQQYLEKHGAKTSVKTEEGKQ